MNIHSTTKPRKKCPHDRQKSQCKECSGSQICPHDRRKSQCKECDGGSICTHNRLKHNCNEGECDGSQRCIHDRMKSQCKECDPLGHLIHMVRSRIYKALKSNKSRKSMEYVGCDIETFKLHISNQFKEGMTWKNYGEWHIDHIIPIKYENPTEEEMIGRLHYLNCQPMWASENISKGNRRIG